MEAVIRFFIIGNIPGTGIKITLKEVIITWISLFCLLAIRILWAVVRRSIIRHRRAIALIAEISQFDLIAL